MQKYRADIDGLRSIAILPVLLYHTGIPLITGGYVGVDIFFVISGFLITGILLRDFDNNTYSVLSFYERRIRRIFGSSPI
ncbi:acyltransferase [Stenotrophomonas maltophilia]|uniref:acyltransferase family protein n=1 Tax=Stenotrophomonas maltophilia TaxID=40324 RepID=UPI0015DD56FF|nr:acyltransferase [Stenotrophomonas maltophilia]MBA0221223.1 acyltransferase [Stenotrophomonas maltophilia]